jgi:hypothetical protein
MKNPLPSKIWALSDLRSVHPVTCTTAERLCSKMDTAGSSGRTAEIVGGAPSNAPDGGAAGASFPSKMDTAGSSGRTAEIVGEGSSNASAEGAAGAAFPSKMDTAGFSMDTTGSSGRPTEIVGGALSDVSAGEAGGNIFSSAEMQQIPRASIRAQSLLMK